MALPLRCPRCLKELDPKSTAKFCPRCGLPDALAAAADQRPVQIAVEGRGYTVAELLATGAIANVYRCEPGKSLKGRRCVFKIARDAINNERVSTEGRVLRQLRAADAHGRHLAFLPDLLESFALTSTTGEMPRQANVLALHPAVKASDEIYTLEEVRDVARTGLGARDMAWIWRRLLTILDFCHQLNIVHGAVFPMHVLIEPTDHKLILIDWCSAGIASNSLVYPTLLAERYERWTRQDGLPLHKTAKADVIVAARSMAYLLGADDGDPASLPAHIEPAIGSHLRRCVHSPPSAGQILTEFDTLIEALWGPKQFQPLTLPPKQRR